MEGLQIEVVYENGVLKLPRQLPLIEGATITITIHPPERAGSVKHARFPWTGAVEDLEYLAVSDENHLWAVENDVQRCAGASRRTSPSKEVKLLAVSPVRAPSATRLPSNR
jgi:predicted DNA-binding antitoxin AbrB/MazE fold protein